MADAITIKALQDASLDAKSLEEVVNGNEVKQVTTRKGETYPSVKKAIKTLFENGGLPAKPFATKAKMETDGASLADGQLAQVYNEDVNNGLYVKTAGVWVKASYDISTPINMLKKTQAVTARQRGVVLRWLDSNGMDLASFLKNGSFRLRGVDADVQSVLNNALEMQSNYMTINNKHNAVLMLSEQGLPIVRLSKNGKVYLGSSKTSVNDVVDNASKKAENKEAFNAKAPMGTYSKEQSSELMISSDYAAILDIAKSKYSNIAPIPKFSAKNVLPIGTSWIDDVTFNKVEQVDFIKIAGFDPDYNDDIGVVHPNVWEFENKVAGYRYWMTINPYTNGNENIELPYIYGTNDSELKDWTLIEGFPAPFEPDPIYESGSYRGHLSDSVICYDPIRGDIIHVWRKNLYFDESFTLRTKVGLLASRFDGQGWSDIYELITPQSAAADFLISPAIIFNPADNLFYMYTITREKMYYKTAPNMDGNNWSAPIACAITPINNVFWHLDAKIIGGKVVVLLNEDDAMSSLDNTDRFYFAISSDFKNFTISAKSITTEIEHHFYKGAFLPVIDPNDLSKTKFKIIYTTDHSEPKWRLRVATTNTFNIGA